MLRFGSSVRNKEEMDTLSNRFAFLSTCESCVGEERQEHNGCAASWDSAPILGWEEMFLRGLY